MLETKLTVTEFSSASVENSHLQEYCQILKSYYDFNKNILLIQIPQFILNSFSPDIAKKRGYYAFPPTGLQYLYEALKQRDLKVRILDLNFLILKKVSEESFDHTRWLSIVEEYLQYYEPFIVGVSCMYDTSIKQFIQILEFLKEYNHSVVITGGVFPTYEWERLLDRELCHFVIRGEGEDKINYLFDYLTHQNQHHSPTAGIFFKFYDKIQGSVGHQYPVHLMGDLIASYDVVPIEEYHRFGALNPFSRMADLNDSPYAALQMNRGCRAACTFCSVRDFMGKKVRTRPLNDIIREMQFLIEVKGIRHFEWLDDDLLYSKQQFQELLKTIIKKNWRITWSANNGIIAAALDADTLSLMRDSGCIGFKIGVETGNEELLRKVRKPGTIKSFRQVSNLLGSIPEIFVGANFMLGLPGETFGQMMDSFRFSLDLDFDWSSFTLCQMIRGATAFSEFEDYFDSQMNSRGEIVHNFIPSRLTTNGRMTTDSNIHHGLDVFQLNPSSVPTTQQTREIWFTFNLVGNYFNNKNLMPGGRVEKFIAWVEMALCSYPYNPYMSLFLALAYVIAENKTKSALYYQKTVENCKNIYWRKRFQQFGLMKILNNFPSRKKEAVYLIQQLRKNTATYFG